MRSFDRDDHSHFSPRSRFRVLNLIRRANTGAADSTRGSIRAVTDKYDFTCFKSTYLQDVI